MTTFAFDADADHLDVESPSTTIFDLASASDTFSLARTRMWRACVCSTTVGAVRLRWSTSLTM